MARNGYQARMIGPRRGYPMMGAAGDPADPRAAALCEALEQCGIPPWRQRQIAPGVQAPCDDLYPLPMRPVLGTPTFIAGGPTTISYLARPQKPFQGERPAAIVTRVGAGAAAITPVIRGAIRIGTDPQAAQIADQPVEFFDRTAFGMRMVMKPAEPGIDIEIDVALVGPALGAGETITVFLTIFGSTWA